MFLKKDVLNKRYMGIVFHSGITMLDFYLDMNAAVLRVDNERKEKMGNVFLIITCDEYVSNH